MLAMNSVILTRSLPAFRWLFVFVLMGTFLLGTGEALAGPGGEIVEAVFKSRWGRIIALILAIIFLPLIIYVVVKEKLAVRRTKRDLEELAKEWPIFSWEHISGRVRNTAEALYRSWSSGDISPAEPYLTRDYFESQQDILDRWTDEGRSNVTKVRKFGRTRPLSVRTPDRSSFAVVCVGINMQIQDYMIEVESGKVTKGNKSWKEKEMIFVMMHDEGEWLLHSIQGENDSLDIASEKNLTDTTYLRQAPERGGLETAAADAPERKPEAEVEQSVVEVSAEAEDERDPSDVDERTEGQ